MRQAAAEEALDTDQQIRALPAVGKAVAAAIAAVSIEHPRPFAASAARENDPRSRLGAAVAASGRGEAHAASAQPAPAAAPNGAPDGKAGVKRGGRGGGLPAGREKVKRPRGSAPHKRPRGSAPIGPDGKRMHWNEKWGTWVGGGQMRYPLEASSEDKAAQPDAPDARVDRAPAMGAAAAAAALSAARSEPDAEVFALPDNAPVVDAQPAAPPAAPPAALPLDPAAAAAASSSAAAAAALDLGEPHAAASSSATTGVVHLILHGSRDSFGFVLATDATPASSLRLLIDTECHEAVSRLFPHGYLFMLGGEAPMQRSQEARFAVSQILRSDGKLVLRTDFVERAAALAAAASPSAGSLDVLSASAHSVGLSNEALRVAAADLAASLLRPAPAAAAAGAGPSAALLAHMQPLSQPGEAGEAGEVGPSGGASEEPSQASLDAELDAGNAAVKAAQGVAVCGAAPAAAVPSAGADPSAVQASAAPAAAPAAAPPAVAQEPPPPIRAMKSAAVVAPPAQPEKSSEWRSTAEHKSQMAARGAAAGAGKKRKSSLGAGSSSGSTLGSINGEVSTGEGSAATGAPRGKYQKNAVTAYAVFMRERRQVHTDAYTKKGEDVASQKLKIQKLASAEWKSTPAELLDFKKHCKLVAAAETAAKDLVDGGGLAPNLAPDAPKGGAFGEAGGLGGAMAGAVGAAEADGLAHGLGFGVAAAAQVHELDESQTEYDDPD